MGLLSLIRLAGGWPGGRSAQATHVAVEAIEEGVVRLAGNPGPEHRAVLEVDGVAIPEASREQEAVLAAYAAFLNGLAFPGQLLVRVLPYDFDAYLSGLSRRVASVCGADKALATLAADHISFLRRLARSQTLLERRCYVVIPAGSATEAAASVGDAGKGARAPDEREPEPHLDLAVADHGRPPLWGLRPRFGLPRVARGATGGNDAAAVRRSLAARCDEATRLLARCGLAARRLDDVALAELFYACWCPERSRVQRLRLHLEAYTSPVVHGVLRHEGPPDAPSALAGGRPPATGDDTPLQQTGEPGTYRPEGGRPCA